MTIPFWCLAAACLLPYLIFGATVRPRAVLPGGLDNNHPRVQQATLEGFGARMIGAHKNAFEALGVFAPAVIVAHLAGADPIWSARLALVFIGARVLHPIFYGANIAPLRTLSFATGLLAALGQFVLAAMA
ncbi:MAG: MAPEG family protein [Myxococcales bacterium]|nr:MAPEG family protein [Myxococcales bacterium]